MHPAVVNVAADVQAFTSNAFLVPGDRTALVDVGANFDAVARVRDRTGDLDAVALTHTHPDHVGNLDAVVDAFDADVWAFDPELDGVDHAVGGGDTFAFGDHEYEAVYTPGHADDHLCLYSPGADVLFAGDLVFANGGFGRTDLAGGDRETLIESVERVRETVGGSLGALHAGHGPSVTRNAADHLDLTLQAARTR
jgi:glyoxylase-like metal-dependent hydrolase (beta-lactamase superfamily II)